MPEVDGFQVAAAIRARELASGDHLPIVGVTARSRAQDRERCLSAGMDGYVSKPIDPSLLAATIDRLMSTGKHALIDAQAVLTACDADPTLLNEMCEDLKTYLPTRLSEVMQALADRDANRLSEAAHKLFALLSAFSKVAGSIASELEDYASHGRLTEAAPLALELDRMVPDLLRQGGDLRLETLR
jgi:DNA-binding response OmpR family regulator